MRPFYWTADFLFYLYIKNSVFSVFSLDKYAFKYYYILNDSYLYTYMYFSVEIEKEGIGNPPSLRLWRRGKYNGKSVRNHR